MKLSLIKRPDALFELSNEYDYSEASKLQAGEIIVVTAKKVRNPIGHKKYFVMHSLYFQNQEEYKSPYWCRKGIEMEAGYKELVHFKFRGETIIRKMPLSVSYETLDEIEFRELRTKCGDVICAKLGISEDELQEEILRLS